MTYLLSTNLKAKQFSGALRTIDGYNLSQIFMVSDRQPFFSLVCMMEMSGGRGILTVCLVSSPIILRE